MEPAQPPDPHTKVPRIKCPPGATDCHFHLFGPRDKYPIDKNSIYDPAEALPETVMAMHKTLGISRGVIVSGGAYAQDPSYMLDVLARYPDYFRGVAIPPDHLSDEDITRMTRLGVRGVRFVTARRGRSLPTILPDVAAAVANQGWHVEFYALGDDIIENTPKLLALPNKRIVLDHFGAVPAAGGVDQPAFKAVLKLLDTGRVWVKISGAMRSSKLDPPYPDVTPLARALIKHAPDRLIWGTDWPHVNMNNRVMPNDGDLIDLLLDWCPDEAVRNRILSDNPAALYDFPTPAGATGKATQ